jgi:pimeloyl-ACP methyl ester carboxylesterase
VKSERLAGSIGAALARCALLTILLTATVACATPIGVTREDPKILSLPLPFGTLELQNRPEQFLWGGYRLIRFIPLIDYKVRGMKNRYRQAGLGVPLAAEVEPVDGPGAEEARKRIPPRVKVPVTAFVHLSNIRERLDTGQVRGVIDLHAVDDATTVETEGIVVPLELDSTAALALGLEGAPVWDSEFGGFLRAGRNVFGDGLIMMHPYRPGRIPVILVHGTASSPARWADIINEVQNDPSLRTTVQIWLFMYNTSNPILYSADLLRRSLERAVADLDPDGKDPALRRMVVMGHSQGGLLTRLMVTDSGQRFWANISNRPFDDVKMSPEVRGLMLHSMFFKPVPYVQRVVFLATPHRGSFRVSTLVMNAVRRVVTLPVNLMKGFSDIAQHNPDLAVHLRTQRLPTAVDNMFASSPFVRVLSESPLASGVPAHSIIAVQGQGNPLGLDDGVVAYKSAHLDGVESEVIVQSPHSLQSNPAAILEVRRILRDRVGAR